MVRKVRLRVPAEDTLVSITSGERVMVTVTYSNRSPSPQRRVLRILERPTGVADNAVDSECRQSHRRNCLEHGSLCHNSSVILNRRNQARSNMVACQGAWLGTHLHTLGIRRRLCDILDTFEYALIGCARQLRAFFVL
jgi:hypothetical protein